MIFDEIVELLSDQMNIDKSMLRPETRFVEDLHTDSLDMVEMLIALEDKYNITVPDEDAKQLETLGKLAEYIESKITPAE